MQMIKITHSELWCTIPENGAHNFSSNRKWLPHMEQEQLTIPEHLIAPLVFSGVRVAQYVVSCLMFCRSMFVCFLFFYFFVLLFAIALSILNLNS